MKLACQEHILPGDGVLEKWEFANSAGLNGIELRGTEDWLGRLDELRAARERGVVFSSGCRISDRFIGGLAAPRPRARAAPRARRPEAVEHMKHLLSGISELGGTGAVTPAAYGLASKRLPPFTVPRTEEADRRGLPAGPERPARARAPPTASPPSGSPPSPGPARRRKTGACCSRRWRSWASTPRAKARSSS